ncbi:Uncharacterised protein [BD1-7 clade bacterium]|uniref:Uncharacterized protein n=1 Tax=BD1-7 clade bacterium TaxID=2029982 RepID=A0A5S9PHD2_9GAMM|nr:Uncharacterised protein [BD1-7 clade bacterium]CAA0103544.1 Uncharacterised protein [BD1-7 clade bacterium]
MISILVGLAMGTSMIFWARTNPKAKLIFTLSLVSLPAIYIGFAVFLSQGAIVAEFLWGIPYLLAPALLLAKSRNLTLIALGVLYVLHGVYDIYHYQLIADAVVPHWYPHFCAALDIVVGGYLLLAATMNIDGQLTRLWQS